MKYAVYAFMAFALHFPFDIPLCLLPMLPEAEIAEVQFELD